MEIGDWLQKFINSTRDLRCWKSGFTNIDICAPKRPPWEKVNVLFEDQRRALPTHFLPCIQYQDGYFMSLLFKEDSVKLILLNFCSQYIDSTFFQDLSFHFWNHKTPIMIVSLNQILWLECWRFFFSFLNVIHLLRQTLRKY